MVPVPHQLFLTRAERVLSKSTRAMQDGRLTAELWHQESRLYEVRLFPTRRGSTFLRPPGGAIVRRTLSLYTNAGGMLLSPAHSVNWRKPVALRHSQVLAIMNDCYYVTFP